MKNIKSTNTMKAYFFGLLFFTMIVQVGCVEDEVLLLDENLLFGNWKVGSKFLVDADDNAVRTSEDNCEFKDSYTFLQDGKLIYEDSVFENGVACGINDEFLTDKGLWHQDDNGDFTFTLFKVDGTSIEIKPKDVYFEFDRFLVIELWKNPNEEGDFVYSQLTLARIE
ncbi:hypothetical protein [Costertonia aggregata]|uniref:Lipocalin family protein n=1 Tax=Costertonia aggregata TaxID=343403 RepID=A0A7H9ANJ5_9FLAO|nr:hypothetical protein [Costertonia aggregata]QLG44845.1 hypothetical protein HYG79_05590 [Costertonia aggregata]